MLACIRPMATTTPLSCTYFIKSRNEAEVNEFAVHLLCYCSDIDPSLLSMVINDKQPDPRIVHLILSQLTDQD